MVEDPRSDGDLLVAASQEDADAFAVFYRRYVQGVLAFFRRQVGSAEVALDLTAETFAAALEGCSRYEERAGAARSWLYGIAWNKLHEAQRRGQVQDKVRRALGMTPIQLTDEGIERIEELAAGPALELLETLPSGQREAVRAHILEERSYSEIARELDCSPGVVRKRVSRGVRAMRARMEASRDE